MRVWLFFSPFFNAGFSQKSPINGNTRTQRRNIVQEMSANLEQIVHFDNDIVIPMNGNEIRISQTLSMIHDNHGKMLGVVLIFRTV